jgi:hypothetical protein
LYAYLTEILEPLLRGVKFTFEQIQRKSRRSVYTSVPPVYLRPDVSSKWESVNSGELPFPLFERWDVEIQAFRAHLNEAEVSETAASDFTAAFESKIYAAHYYVPLDTEKNPKVIDHLELGALLPVFTDWSELAKLFKPGARVTVWPFSAVYAAIARYTEFSGVVINPGGRNLVASRRQLDRIFCRATGRNGVYSRLAQMKDITAAEQIPRDLAANLAESLRRRPEVRAVYYLSVKTDDMPPVPLLAVDCACPEHLAFPAVESAMRKSTASSLLFSITKADAGLLKRAGALTQPVYIRDG